LKQGLNDPYTVEDQVAIIYAGSKNLLRNVPVNKVKNLRKISWNSLTTNTEQL
jgi:F-type H+-transporting ATPase subunit alpha